MHSQRPWLAGRPPRKAQQRPLRSLGAWPDSARSRTHSRQKGPSRQESGPLRPTSQGCHSRRIAKVWVAVTTSKSAEMRLDAKTDPAKTSLRPHDVSAAQVA
eukprot:5171553-Prymnesium_polylepis.1